MFWEETPFFFDLVLRFQNSAPVYTLMTKISEAISSIIIRTAARISLLSFLASFRRFVATYVVFSCPVPKALGGGRGDKKRTTSQ